MTRTRKWLRVLLVIAMPWGIGCAPAYHSYSGCHIDCTCCPPPPLPYVHYEGCQCHSCPVQVYLDGTAQATGPIFAH